MRLRATEKRPGTSRSLLRSESMTAVLRVASDCPSPAEPLRFQQQSSAPFIHSTMRRESLSGLSGDERSAEKPSFKGAVGRRGAEEISAGEPRLIAVSPPPLRAVIPGENPSVHKINPTPVLSNPQSAEEVSRENMEALQRPPAAQARPPPAPPSNSAIAPHNERKMFFVFVKVLMKYLEKANDNLLRNRAKAIIQECTIRNRNGESDYLCLQGAIERRLQQSLGRFHWDRAQLCYHKFLERCRMPSTIEVTSSACV